MRQDKVMSITFAVIMFAGGLYCLLAPALAIETIAMIAGLGLVFYGLGHLFVWMSRLAMGLSDYWLLACAIVALALGAVIWGSGMAKVAFAVMLVYCFAAQLFLCGILSIMHAVSLRKIHVTYNTKSVGTRWFLLAVSGVLLICMGVFCVFFPGSIAASFSMLLGIALIVGAVSSVANVFAE